MATKFFSSKSNAKRAVLKAGLTEAVLFQNENGEWGFALPEISVNMVAAVTNQQITATGGNNLKEECKMETTNTDALAQAKAAAQLAKAQAKAVKDAAAAEKKAASYASKARTDAEKEAAAAQKAADKAAKAAAKEAEKAAKAAELEAGKGEREAAKAAEKAAKLATKNAEREAAQAEKLAKSEASRAEMAKRNAKADAEYNSKRGERIAKAKQSVEDAQARLDALLSGDGEMRNGQRKPGSNTKCGRAWAILDNLIAQNDGEIVKLGAFVEACKVVGEDEVGTVGNVTSEYYFYRRFHGISGRAE